MKEFIPELDEQGFMKYWADLKKSHRGTYWMLKKYQKAIIASSFKNGVQIRPDHPDLKMIKEAISDNIFAIGWLHTCKSPGNKRGVENRKAYAKKKVYMNPQLMEAVIQKQKPPAESKLTNEQLFKIEDALSRLAPRERECFEMRHGDLLELHEIAEHLGISIGSVQNYIKRAERKIAEDLENSLFLI